MASTMRARPLAERALVVASVDRRVIPLVESGALIVPIAADASRCPHADHAYDRFAAGAKIGKVVLVDCRHRACHSRSAEAET